MTNGTTGLSYLISPASTSLVTGFDQVVSSGGGGADTAQMFDSPQDDRLTASPESVRLEAVSGAYLHQAEGFSAVYVTADGGGQDTANLEDSPGDDLFYAEPRWGYMAYGTGQFLLISASADGTKGFSRISATAAAGGEDIVYLLDAAAAGANDTLVATQGSAQMSDGAGGSYANSATGFDQLYAYSRSGSDTATLTGSSGDDTLTILPAIAVMVYGGGGQSVAIGFHAAEGTGGPGGLDSAYLYDSAGDDVYHLSRDQQTVETTGAGGHVYGKASGFDIVFANAYNGGRDRMNFVDQLDSNFFYGTLPLSYMYYSDGTLVGEYAGEEVDVTFTGGNETVLLNGSPYLQESLRNETSSDLRLEDQAGSYWMYLHGLDDRQDQVTATLQANDTSTITPAAVDYLFSVQ